MSAEPSRDVDPSAVLAEALHISGTPDGLPPLLPEHEAMQKLKPLMNSLKQACGHDRAWAPAVHRLLFQILSTVSRHTRPNHKLFCPCCTSLKNRELFGHYYNTTKLVCKRCSTKFRELVSSNKIRPESNAFHARLTSVMDVNEVGKRKRKTREWGNKSDTESVATSVGTVEPAVIRAPKAPRQGSPGPSPPGKVEEEDDCAGSATSSGSNTDRSVVMGGGGLWGDVSSASSDSSDAGDSVDHAVVAPDLFHDLFDVELNYSLTDLPLFGAAPGEAGAGVDAAESGRRDRVSSDGSGSSGSAPFAVGMTSLPTAADGSSVSTASTGHGITKEQFTSLVSVTSCVVVPATDGGSEVPLDRASTDTRVAAGSYNLKLSIHAVVPTACMVSAMVVELPTELSTSDTWEHGGPAPQRIVWDTDARPPTKFKETLFAVEAEGAISVTSALPFEAAPHAKLAVVAFVTTTAAAEHATFSEMLQHRVPMIPAGGYFEVVPCEE